MSHPKARVIPALFVLFLSTLTETVEGWTTQRNFHSERCRLPSSTSRYLRGEYCPFSTTTTRSEIRANQQSHHELSERYYEDDDMLLPESSPPTDAASITFINDSSTTLDGGNLHMQQISTGRRVSVVGSVSPGTTETLFADLGADEDCGIAVKKLGAHAIKFVTTTSISSGVIFHPDSIEVRNGSAVRVVDDQSNLSLGMKRGGDFSIVDAAVLRHREKGKYVSVTTEDNPATSTAMDDDNGFWRNLATQFGRESMQKLKRYYMDGYSAISRKYNWWDEAYQQIGQPMGRSAVEIVDILTHRELKRYSVHVYWRSLDRSTGGREDEFATIRYNFTVNPNDNPCKVGVSAIACLHGHAGETIELYGPYTPASMQAGSSLSLLHEMLCNLVLEQESSDATFTIIDNETESIDWDTQDWCSVEVLFFVSNNTAEDELVFRLHQDCLYEAQHYLHNERPFHPLPGTKAQKRLITQVSKLVDIGVPVDWAWEGLHFGDDWQFVVSETKPENKAFLDFLNVAHLKQENLKPKRLGQSGRFPMHFRF